MEIGKVLLFYRTLYGLTQTEIAEKAGINEKYYGRLERGESVPTLDKIEMLCRALDLRLVDLFAENHIILPESEVGCPANEEVVDGQVFYCNCCGTTFSQPEAEEITCPNCQCKFDEDSEYIEVMNI